MNFVRKATVDIAQNLRLMKRALVIVLVVAACGLAWAAGKMPFDPKWQGKVVIWDFRKNELMCHDEKVQLIGEEEPTIQLGTDRNGKPIAPKFRLLTYNCSAGKHLIRIWMENGMDLIREVSCHGTRVCEDKGYDDDEKGNKVHCPDGPEGHDMILKGTAKEAK